MTADGGDGGGRRRRVSRWDRPPPPHDWRWVVGGAGRVLIAVGLLLFGFVAYQLWGTGLEYRASQDELEEEFAELLAAVPPVIPPAPATTTAPTTTPTTTTTSSATVEPTTTAPTTIPATTMPSTTTALAAPPLEPGGPIARIEIPRIGLDAVVVNGVTPHDLQQGPGHYPETPLPGELGNAAIAGHRTTWGQPFYRIDEVEPGDEIILTTLTGRFVYVMTASVIVAPERSDVVATTDDTIARLTLTSCHPRYSANERIVVQADLDVGASNAPPARPRPRPPRPDPATPSTRPGEDVPNTAATTATAATTVTIPDDPTVTTVAAMGAGRSGDVSDEAADAFAHGWFSDDAAFPQVALWGTIVSAIAVGASLLSRRLRRNWVGALTGIVPFVVALYFLFQNVNRLLPAAL